MKAAVANKARAIKRLTAPLLECLEDRRLLSGKPSATVMFQETPGLTSGTTDLLITDNVKNDSISINDNGSGTRATSLYRPGMARSIHRTAEWRRLPC